MLLDSSKQCHRYIETRRRGFFINRLPLLDLQSMVAQGDTFVPCACVKSQDTLRMRASRTIQHLCVWCLCLQVVPDKALLRLAAQRPDFVLELGLRMSQGLKQQLGQLEAIQQVGGCASTSSQLA